jgi:transcription-repair coupling factor (superfamily II helicase)
MPASPDLPEDLISRLTANLAPGPGALEGLPGSSAAFFFGLLHLRTRRPLLWVCPSNQEMEEVAQDLRFFLGSDPAAEVLLLPGPESDPYRGLSPHPGLASRRAATLARLGREFRGVLVTSLSGLVHKTVPPEELQARCRPIVQGTPASRDALISDLRSLGYAREDPVSEVGEFSFRGGIVDVFSPAHPYPLRIEFFGDEVESIRQFDPATQRSVGRLPEAVILPMREVCPTAAEISEWHRRAPEYWREVRYAEALSELFQFTEAGELFNGFEYLFPLVIPTSATLLDFLPGDGLTVVLEGTAAELRLSLEERWAAAAAGYQDCCLAGLPALPPSTFMLAPEELDRVLGGREVFHLQEVSGEEQGVTVLDVRPAHHYHGRIQELLADLQDWRSRQERAVFVMPTEGMAQRLVDIFRDYDVVVPAAGDGFSRALQWPASVATGRVSAGFHAPRLGIHVLTEAEILGERAVQEPPRPRGESLGTFISDFRDLQPGDYVVHVDHGIGIFRGLERVGFGDRSAELMLIEYAGGSKLYVPLDRLELVQKYASGESARPQIDRLGGASWKRTKARIRKSVRALAEDLLKLYARREMSVGHAFSRDDALMHEFEETFEYEETPDQRAAIEACKRDMESERPMDRLVCGDVGYGKTEVAMRAAFKAVNDGKQVAVLAPTTVLAFQHYNTFRQRFQGFPVRIAMLSRFLSREQQREVVEQVRLGLVDILIGTHRILSRDLRFHDLGLIVVDEEQRFGVAQKERLKQLKAHVDVLTLSATPIPRTLNMSLVGIRDLSVIETAPKDRLAIQTVVVKYSPKVIRSAIDLELKRAGQVFFLHNSVETIYAMAQSLQEIVPEARFGVAHGQMGEDQLEQVMLDFLNYRYDVLVCTTIIENGLDIPRANTIIVNHADRFGLAQLYQLRGRVGRSNRRAYAYLLIAGEEVLTGDAKRRLSAIREFSDLGSGFRLAALDLEIRGAGNLLGGEQSGHIQAVGFELYVKLLEETIRELKGEPEPEEFRTVIDLRCDIQIPEHYIDDANQRLWLYKRLSTVPSLEKLDLLRDEIVDRFGRYPRSVANLLDYTRLRLLAQPLRLASIERKGRQVRLAFRSDTPLAPERVVQLVHERPGLAFSTDGTLVASIPPGPPAEVLAGMMELLGRLLQEI